MKYKSSMLLLVALCSTPVVSSESSSEDAAKDESSISTLKLIEQIFTTQLYKGCDDYPYCDENSETGVTEEEENNQPPYVNSEASKKEGDKPEQ